MWSKLFIVLFGLLFSPTVTAQVVDSTMVEVDTLDMESKVSYGENAISNTKALEKFFEKLYLLETTKTGKVRVVHIGDSHIQADLFTGVIRKNLQEKFGNGGLGFSFPHNLARTNGSYFMRYSSNADWNTHKITKERNGSPVGLSGISLTTKSKGFAVEINVKDNNYQFNTMKIVTPGNAAQFDMATSSKTIVLESNVPKKIVHKIKNGEAISTIADKYNISVAELKKANGLKSDKIRAGKTLKIPTNEMQKRSVKHSEFIPLPLTQDAATHSFYSETLMDKIYLIPNKSASTFALNGLIFEKNEPGITYSAIGVNGAKASDYNKCPMFFDQVPALEADLIIVSLGTNETFDKMPVQDYMNQLSTFLSNIKAKNPNAEVLVMSTPPSLLYRRSLNRFADDYARAINNQAVAGNHASWDLFAIMGGMYGVNRNYRQGLMSGDKVHYTKAGYEKQGALFSQALIDAYENFKATKKK
ncbi:GDSL-type esterase/lipase family protein [Flavobacterium enshiense]|uniref:Peptidoglycan-binding protein n=1 Tax=Flavobacterium enshiense DK69 TaxID=1107311 RepID=A0A0A2MY44_9FLAO|nr:GDSL-type esterase/lipase family protein [Flavobacterium enshiense]KGO97244.1 peptidoglycan-binding protein [Flavobacterium enshiense DK69]